MVLPLVVVVEAVEAAVAAAAMKEGAGHKQWHCDPDCDCELDVDCESNYDCDGDGADCDGPE